MQRNLQQQLDGFSRRSPGYGSRYYTGNGQFMRLSAADVRGPEITTYPPAQPRERNAHYEYVQLNKKKPGRTRKVVYH